MVPMHYEISQEKFHFFLGLFNGIQRRNFSIFEIEAARAEFQRMEGVISGTGYSNNSSCSSK
jgi:hypothetical protein